MTTRHTISHADELYVGNAYEDGYSPDGRRGIEMKHIYVREYGAIAALDSDGIMSASAAPSAVVATFAVAENMLSRTLCTGALNLVTTGATFFTLDVPRNLVFLATAVAGKILKVEGLDEYGNKMCESITATSNDAYSSGFKAFKIVNKMYTTAVATCGLNIGTGKRIGLPFHLSNVGRFLGLRVDGYAESASLVGGATAYVLTTGLTISTADSTSENAPDVRGTINLGAAPLAPDGTKVFTAMMLVDHTTRAKAFGELPATAIT